MARFQSAVRPRPVGGVDAGLAAQRLDAEAESSDTAMSPLAFMAESALMPAFPAKVVSGLLRLGQAELRPPTASTP